ncbi:MAG: protein kinase [Actinobacteria bacterium]|nr:protein kinase [Actinomycetota bacterium]
MSSTVIAGRYELGERLGYGGMSTVQLAVDRRLERQVAVKLLAEHLADDSQFVSRFRREALSAARLVHPNIVQVFDFGLDEASGRHYIVMEYIHGRSGAEILREETRLGVADTLELVDGACRGLAHAHRMGVVHRDVKPGNIMRSDDGAVKLADFGIAKAMVGQTSQITQAGSVLGTAAYLAPEQASGAEVGPPADLYGLGVVTYQLLAGRLPYDASSLTELAMMQQREYPIRLDEVVSEVPPALALAVEKALALEPEERYASADEMRVALHDGARGIAPAGADATAATAMLERGERTAATNVAPSSAQGSARRLQPTPPRDRVPPAQYEPIPEMPPSRRDSPPPRRSQTSRIVAVVLVAGVAGIMADALPMGSSGYLAAKREQEVYAHEIAMERDEIALRPEVERDELALIYEAKGMDPAAAHVRAPR